MRRLITWKFGVVLAVVSLFAAGWAFVYEPIRAHLHWRESVSGDIKSLAHKRPPGVTPGQWTFAVDWTMNLHANCGSDPWGADREWQKRFGAELNRRLQGPVTLADIEWIWDEYAEHTKGGRRYSDNYRPTRDPHFRTY